MAAYHLLYWQKTGELCEDPVGGKHLRLHTVVALHDLTSEYEMLVEFVHVLQDQHVDYLCVLVQSRKAYRAQGGLPCL